MHGTCLKKKNYALYCNEKVYLSNFI
jgi:hypothetical protein